LGLAYRLRPTFAGANVGHPLIRFGVKVLDALWTVLVISTKS
jgi:hypothetical protein